MLLTVYHQLIALVLAAVANILMGLYNNIGKEGCSFSIKTLLQGIVKVIIIVMTFLVIAYCFDMTDLSALGVTPDLVINAAIVLYMTKAMHNMMKILGVTNIKPTTTSLVDSSVTNTSSTNTFVDSSTNDNSTTENKPIRKNFEDSVG